MVDFNTSRLSEARKLRNIRQYEMAREFNMHPAAYGKWELGKRNVNACDLAKIATILNLPITYFFEEPPWEGVSA